MTGRTPARRESGIGLVETLVAAAVLSTSVAGTIYLTSTSSQLGNESTTAIKSSDLGSAVVEIAQFNPDVTYITSQLDSMQTNSGSTAFTVSGVGVSTSGSTESISVTVSWSNPYLDGENKSQYFTLGSNATADSSFQTLENIVGSESGGEEQASTYTVSTSVGPGATISPTSAQVASGGTTSFAVGVTSGYENVSVTGCGGSLSGSTYTTGAITADCTVTAIADEITYVVNTSAGTGVEALSCNDSTVSSGGSTSCTASLSTGYESLSLSGCNGSASGSPYTTGAITEDCTVIASATAIQYTVSTSPGAGTTISPSAAVVGYGATPAFSLATTGGYTNLSAGGTCGGALVDTTFTTAAITEDCTVTSSALAANQDPTAVDDTTSITEDVSSSVSGNVLSNDSDSDGGTLSATAASTTLTYGSLTIGTDGSYTYTLIDSTLDSLDSGQSATDSYGYTVLDGQGGSDTATLTITVNGADEPNVAPTAVDDTTSITEDVSSSVSGNVLSNDSDSDGGTLSATAASTTLTYGSLTIGTDGSYTYTLIDSTLDSLDSGQSATDSYGYTVLDGQGGSDTATLTITVNGADEPNVAPTAVDDTTSITEDVSSSVSGNVLSNDSDSDGGTLSATAASTTLTYGSLTIGTDGSYTYTLIDSTLDSLDSGQSATDSYGYTVLDGQGGSDTATLTITVNGADEPNVAPTAVDDTTSITEDVSSSVSGNVLSNDSDSDGGTLSATAASTTLTYGSLTIGTDGSYTYTLIDSTLDSLDSGQSATDSYGYTVLDGQGGSDTATLTITVNGADEASGMGNGIVTVNAICVQNSRNCGFSVSATSSPSGLCTMSPSSGTATASSSCFVAGGTNTQVTIDLVVNPNKKYCTGSGSASGGNYTPQLTLDANNTSATVRVEITNGQGNCANAPSITYE